MSVKEFPVSRYNEFYKTHDQKRSERRRAVMMPIFDYIIEKLKSLGVKTILEIGCGSGDFLSLCRDNKIMGCGFDFSPAAIAISKDRNKLDNVWIGDAREAKNYIDIYDAYVSLQVLEHIVQDFDVIRNLKPNTPFIFSLPNWIGADAHVRCFTSDAQISARYDSVIDIESILTVKAGKKRERRVVIGVVKNE